jgi:hypothetical protein
MEVGRDDVANSPRPRDPSRSEHACRRHKKPVWLRVGARCVSTRPGTHLAFGQGRWLPGLNDGITTAKAAMAAAHRFDVSLDALARRVAPGAGRPAPAHRRTGWPVCSSHPRGPPTPKRGDYDASQSRIQPGPGLGPRSRRGARSRLSSDRLRTGPSPGLATHPHATGGAGKRGRAVHGIAGERQVDLQPRHRRRRIWLRQLAVQGRQARPIGGLE